MEELDYNDFGGTNINNLKNNNLNDIDFDNILNNLKMSETENDDNKTCSTGLCSINSRQGKKKQVSMSEFARKINNNLDNINDGPQPINYDKQMENNDKIKNILPKEIVDIVNNNNNKNNNTEETNSIDKYINYFKNNYSKLLTQDIVIYTVLFLLLNNNFIIRLLYRPLIARYEKYHANLIIRTILFFTAMYLVKYKLLYSSK